MKMTKEEAFEYLKGKKIMVLDEDQSSKVQKKLFQAGFVWANEEVGIVKHLDKPFLFTYEDKELTYVDKTGGEYFHNHSHEFISLYEILELEIQEEKEEPQFKFGQVVLFRDRDDQVWAPDHFARINKTADEFPYVMFGGYSYRQCIPYEGNEHLLGTTNMP